MRVELKKQECLWLLDLVKQAKLEAAHSNNQTPHRLYALRRDNMADLESKLNTAIQKQIQRERNQNKDAR